MVNYGVYSYIFTFFFGLPSFLALKALNRVGVTDFAIAAVFLSVIPCALFYFITDFSKLYFYVLCFVANVLACMIFWILVFYKK